ncbi:hypothetical protein ACAG25_16250 [Mycobacterium sp. pV006]|uniref:hypothetical protein n=1 Tax=Mycobacterium sp. pV006 TaxID=3238983 RepID=UPI00351B9C81
MTQWSGETHRRIAAAIRKARGKRSAQWLADRTAELNYPITRAQIANYESGRKQSLDIVELLVIAAALNTSPVALVYPGPYAKMVELLPGVEVPEMIAVEWFSANIDWRLESAKLTDIERANSELAEKNTRLLRRSREHFDASMTMRTLIEADDPSDSKLIEVYNQRIRELAKEIAEMESNA